MQPAIRISIDDDPSSAGEIVRAAVRSGFRAFEFACRTAWLLDEAERNDRIAAMRALLPDVRAWTGLALIGQTDEPGAGIVAGMHGARALGVRSVSFQPEPMRANDATIPERRYERAYADWVTLLLDLRYAAEEHGVELWAVVGSAGFLTSPLEVRTLIDQVNSAYMGIALDVDRAAALSDPADWVHILLHRLRAVYLVMTGADAAEPAGITGALRIAQFAGPVVATHTTAFDAAFAELGRHIGG